MRKTGLVGLAVCAYGTYLMCDMTPEMTRLDVIIWTSIRAAGMGLAIMPMMTAAIDAVPAEQTNQGSAIMNVVQQVAGALGLATLGAIATAQQAQLFADRSSLTRPDASLPAHNELSPATFAAFYRRAEYLQAQLLGTSYANMFLILTLVTSVCAALSLFLRPTRATADTTDAEPPRTEATTPTHLPGDGQEVIAPVKQPPHAPDNELRIPDPPLIASELQPTSGRP